jgi:hypothetical protein
VPLGLVVAVIGTGALLLAVRLLTGDRWRPSPGLGVMPTTVLPGGPGRLGRGAGARRRRTLHG